MKAYLNKVKRMIYCINSMEKVDYKTETVAVDMDIDGVCYRFEEEHAFCEKCGEEVYVPEINDANAARNNKAYAKACNAISASEIESILKTFDIAAQPFAKIVGLGEITVNRYLNGRTPSKSISDKLYSIKRDFNYFDELLEESKNEISSVAYSKSKEATDKIKRMYNKSDINQVALFFWNKDDEITKLSLQKLLYYSNGLYNAIYGEKLFNDKCQAWQHGPVYPSVYGIYADSEGITLGEINEDFYNLSVDLSKEKQEFLNVICNEFGKYSGSMLRKMTHIDGTPWSKTRAGLEEDDYSDRVIDDKVIEDYFCEVVKKYGIKNDLKNGVKKYCSEMLSVI